MVNLLQKGVFGKKAGFTLTEVVVASALMIMVFIVVLSAMSYGRRSASLTENRLASLHIARQVLESLSKKSYTASELKVGTTQLAGNRGNYVVTEDSDGRTKNVTVVIQWVEPVGGVQSVSLVTSISRSLHK